LPEVVTPGVGLISMCERAEELGGAFAIHPRQAGGTEVEVRLPLD
jgi:two-component system NarL family sensor kinase